MWIIPFDPLHHSIRQTPLSFPFFIWVNWGSVKLNNLPEVHSAIPLPSSSPRQNHKQMTCSWTHSLDTFIHLVHCCLPCARRHACKCARCASTQKCPQCNWHSRAGGQDLSDGHEHTSHMWPEWDTWTGTQRKSITQSRTEMTTPRLRSRGEGDEARAPHLDPDTRQHTHTPVTWLILWSC